MKIERGKMIMKNGKAWGKTWEDGHSTSFYWTQPEDAMIFSEHLKRPSDATYSTDPQIKELNTGKIVYVERKTEVIIVGD